MHGVLNGEDSLLDQFNSIVLACVIYVGIVTSSAKEWLYLPYIHDEFTTLKCHKNYNG